MVIELLLISVGLIGLLAASISDLKTREVPDWISYGLIISGMVLRGMQSLAASDWWYLGYGVIGLVVAWIIGNLMFRAKQWGGGDAKLIMGIGTIFVTRPSYLPLHDIPFLAVTLINTMLVGAVYGILYGIFLAIKNGKKFLQAAGKINKEKKVKMFKIIALSIAIIVILISKFTAIETGIKMALGIASLLMLLYPYVFILIKGVEKSSLFKHISVNKLTPGDWVEQDVYKNGKIIYKKKPLGIEKEDILILTKAKIKEVLVKEGIPFIPPFFIGVLISVITGKIIGIL
jgi:Flp pilus assembly protein protease CpaA